jgi:hypothetical protein
MKWMTKYMERGFHKIYIYNKSDPHKEISCNDFKAKGTMCEVKRIPNVGVCDHTYLYHIVHEYNNLADVTIFAPGSADMDHKIKTIDFTINKAFETKNTVFNTFEFDIGVGEAMYNFTMPIYDTGYRNNKNGSLERTAQKLADIRPFGAWYEANFPGEQTNKASFFGIMAISREHIHKKPKSFYEGLLRQVETDKFHEASHFMERAWTGMVHPIPDSCYYTSEIFDEWIRGHANGYQHMRRNGSLY